MDRKFFIFIIILLLLAAGGVFWWWSTKEDEPEEGETFYEMEFAKDYTVRDALEGKVVENKEEGLIIRVPDEWVVKQYAEELVLFSPEIEFNEHGDFILESAKEKGGCGVSIEIKKCKKVDPEIETDAETLGRLIAETRENPIETETKKQRVVMIDNKSALERVTLQEGEVKYILTEVPVNHTVYSFSTGVIFAEKCIQEFDKVLQTVEIRK